MLRDTCVFALYAEKGPVGYLSEVVSCWRIHTGGMWTTKSAADQLRCNQKAIDLLDAHFRGRYHRLLMWREYQVWWTSLRSLAERGKYREGKMVILGIPLASGAVDAVKRVGLGLGRLWGILVCQPLEPTHDVISHSDPGEAVDRARKSSKRLCQCHGQPCKRGARWHMP
jgi:hypothetical protein